ncbi:hypothetical protein BG015_004177 [Linnemannia schmuckeri]|uniref:WRKY domain-containing protein n=1 Tax=Linnemannia schmuckeri TaxID=64567 RepID=A0A9P5S7G4_9FUNG|nr:hypothetical protein BG015_004177 [Linnemannia schmuckeri]
MNSSSSFGFLPYQASASQMSSPGAQAHPQHHQQHSHQQQQHHHPHHHQQQQTLSQQQLSHELAQELSSPPPLPLHASSLHSSSSTAASLSGSSTSPISVSASGTLLSATVNSNGNHGAGNNNATHGNNNGLGGNTGSNTSTAVGSPTGVGPTVASNLGGSQHGGHPTINTAMLSNYGGMLSSPPHSSQAQSSSNSSTPGSILPTTPHQTADLDTILATYASQPELLKMIIASKTEEDRRWAEEARFKMMDLMLRENRGMNLMTGYEGLLAQTSQTNPTGTPGSSITTGNMGGHPSSSTTTATTTSTATPQPSSTTVSPTSATMQIPTTSLGLSSTGKRFMDDDDFDSPSSASLSGVAGGLRGGNGTLGGLGGVGLAGGGNGGGGFGGQGPEHGLARKRSVTFARDIHHGHLRSQSMSSMPSGPHSISTVTSTPLSNPSNQFGTLSMLGLTGPNTSLQSHISSSFQQHPQPPSSGSLTTLQQQYQQPSHQSHQPPHHQTPHQFPQHQHQQNQHLPPQFGQYPQMFSYHTTLPQLQHQNVIRRTNSLSHLSQFAQSSVSGGTNLLDQQRLAAGRPRNVSASSLRTQDDSDEESDDDYSDHPVMGGMNSRPGSSLSMNNMMGGNGETSLTLEFSDLASVSGPSGLGQGGYSHHQHQQHQSPHHHQSYGGHNSVVSMTMAALGPGAITSTGLRPASGSLSSLTGGSGGGGGGADVGSGGGNGVGADQKRKRKRREMQPVNKIVDSAEPHIDQFLWKNNGNTTQKKTGCKSIYYKCSNSANGCTVNKTVTEKEGGGYVTKYRGEHLDDCIKLKRAQQAAQAAQQAAHHAYST